MKKFLSVIAVAFATLTVSAQSSKLVTKTITTADTVTFSNVPSKLVAFQYTFTETSGTTAGKVIFEGTVNGTWVGVDSLTLTDVTTAQTKVFPILSSNGTTYLSYRFRNTNTSSATGTIRAAWLRRTDE
ncbi:hypothetical protein ESA94_20410 [Lacibacter luteus]|uniref:Uncharacterized protein n=1 Tax=Lacibacter luteus TaxID=2508719 RepID=A0A4Q1CDB2_9BACT|nr:hypothetical protein [Lacibacter luteus]RXK57564.1 hypothetical protein ESA94_20410 [Lacibacter luteus]